MKTSFKYLAIMIAAISFLAGCQSLEKMQKMAAEVTLDVQPTPLEMHGDSVEIKLTGSFPPKFYPACEIWRTRGNFQDFNLAGRRCASEQQSNFLRQRWII